MSDKRKSGGAALELGERSREELASMFGQMFAGWDRGVNMEGPDTGFRETPMTVMELEARYVAAEIGCNIYQVCNRAAFAPILIYENIQKFLGPVFAAQQATIDRLTAREAELVELLRLAGRFIDPNKDPPRLTNREVIDLIDCALSADAPGPDGEG